ncbi:hypothetical protein AAV94_12955 [Lampropedia cohaerens]|uniref:Branched-chain amino acid transport n=1 Tax=Lampropedia cohaerens TaxID=1610491 RepID=A0A0U1PWW5_9BURK|nr:AzlD domain-containing protein [Lampropedia cohaerens]KKW66971.1 hypothetical protein AAV94_12955 [Lampropedia cohaerens]
MNHAWWIVLLSGAGTFLLRWLPLRQALRASRAAPSGRQSAPARLLQALLAGVGAAAIGALLVVSLWGVTALPAWHAERIIACVLALAVVALLHRWLRTIAIPTLVGALVYGALTHWLA